MLRKFDKKNTGNVLLHSSSNIFSWFTNWCTISRRFKTKQTIKNLARNLNCLFAKLRFWYNPSLKYSRVSIAS